MPLTLDLGEAGDPRRPTENLTFTHKGAWRILNAFFHQRAQQLTAVTQIHPREFLSRRPYSTTHLVYGSKQNTRWTQEPGIPPIIICLHFPPCLVLTRTASMSPTLTATLSRVMPDGTSMHSRKVYVHMYY